MARRTERVALDVDDISFLPDGTGRALIRRSKTDQAGKGNTAYLGRGTVRLLKAWLEAAFISEGAVMQAGRWKSNRMPMRYGEHALAARGGMARAAKAQGRA
jgi:hypothetical protein